jgi:hypothetical protein
MSAKFAEILIAVLSSPSKDPYFFFGAPVSNSTEFMDVVLQDLPNGVF